jgi:hypothetical protein
MIDKILNLSKDSKAIDQHSAHNSQQIENYSYQNQYPATMKTDFKKTGHLIKC